MTLREWFALLFKGTPPPEVTGRVTSTGYVSSTPMPPQPVRGDFGHFDGTCPRCGTKDKWYRGPEGGMNINIKCAHCGQWLNACPALGIAEIIDKED